MIASYLVFTQLFNTYCAAKMEKSWNTFVGNEFVYFYEKVNEQERHEDPDLMNLGGEDSLLGELTGELVIDGPIKHNYIKKFLEGQIKYDFFILLGVCRLTF